jgi:hypothetical protein
MGFFMSVSRESIFFQASGRSKIFLYIHEVVKWLVFYVLLNILNTMLRGTIP